jgi:DNA-binding NarL/FixJ family response regulator
MNTNEVNTKNRIPVAEPAAGPHNRPTPIKVWLVDDNDSYRTLLAEHLAKHAGIECPRDFGSPDAALSALASKAGPDVLLLDIHMRDQNGLDAVGPIKALSRDTRVLMLTSCYDSEYYSRALEEGASGFLLKSHSLDEIIAEIRKPTPADQPRPRRRKRARAAQGGPTRQTPTVEKNRWWRRFSSIIGFPA